MHLHHEIMKIYANIVHNLTINPSMFPNVWRVVQFLETHNSGRIIFDSKKWRDSGVCVSQNVEKECVCVCVCVCLTFRMCEWVIVGKRISSQSHASASLIFLYFWHNATPAHSALFPALQHQHLSIFPALVGLIDDPSGPALGNLT